MAQLPYQAVQDCKSSALRSRPGPRVPSPATQVYRESLRSHHGEGSRWDLATAVTRTQGACDGLALISAHAPGPPSPGPCVDLTSHAHLPLQGPLPRHHCAPRTRDTMTRSALRTRQKVTGRVMVLRAGAGASGGPVGTVGEGSSLCAQGIVALAPDHPSLWGRGRAPNGEMGLVRLLPQRRPCGHRAEGHEGSHRREGSGRRARRAGLMVLTAHGLQLCFGHRASTHSHSVQGTDPTAARERPQRSVWAGPGSAVPPHGSPPRLAQGRGSGFPQRRGCLHRSPGLPDPCLKQK